MSDGGVRSDGAPEGPADPGSPDHASVPADDPGSRAPTIGGSGRLKTLLIGGALVVLVGGGVWLQSVRGGSAVAEEVELTTVVEETGIAYGAAGTRVEVFVDYQCSHCADLDLVIGPELEAMASAGEAQLFLRPVNYVSPGSGRGAAALRCAAETEVGLGMHEAMLANMDGDFTNDGLTALAGTLGLDEAEFAACMSDPATRAWVRGSDGAALDDGMSGLPSVYIDGVRLTDSQLSSGASLREAVASAAD